MPFNFGMQKALFGKALCAVLLLLLTISLTGCLAARVPAELTYLNGATIDSLSSNASLSFSTSERSISGSGVLMYRKPDQMRAVILSPFGSVLQEVFVSGDLVTIIDVGNGVAFSGVRSDLPETGDSSGWRYIHWLIDIDPSDSARRTSVVQRNNRFGEMEKAFFENGLLVSKSTAAGGIVKYSKYTAHDGVPIPLEISYETAAKEKFTILLEDPDIHASFAEDTFTPKLSTYRVYPLSLLK